MIKCYANKHNHKVPVSVDADGTIEEIVDDIGNITNVLYFQLMKQYPQLAEEFKEGILNIFAGSGTAWMTHEELMKEADHGR